KLLGGISYGLIDDGAIFINQNITWNGLCSKLTEHSSMRIRENWKSKFLLCLERSHYIPVFFSAENKHSKLIVFTMLIPNFGLQFRQFMSARWTPSSE